MMFVTWVSVQGEAPEERTQVLIHRVHLADDHSRVDKELIEDVCGSHSSLVASPQDQGNVPSL